MVNKIIDKNSERESALKVSYDDGVVKKVHIIPFNKKKGYILPKEDFCLINEYMGVKVIKNGDKINFKYINFERIEEELKKEDNDYIDLLDIESLRSNWRKMTYDLRFQSDFIKRIIRLINYLRIDEESEILTLLV